MKKRLDVLLVERGLAISRAQAQAIIMAGQVMSDGRVFDKSGVQYDEAIELRVKHQPKYVSRAGDKLASVAGSLGLEFKDRMVLDVGSSTGGFTDFALQNGAGRVYCIDVGTGQLAYKLRQDSRVVVMEQTDIRDVVVEVGALAAAHDIGAGSGAPAVKHASIPAPADIAVIDVSFISLTKVLEAVARLVAPDAPIVAMAKPQFEAGRAIADRYHGVIPLGSVRDEILATLHDWLDERFVVEGEADSGLAGAEGNLEHFFLLRVRP